jgi:alkaline phosphatase D
MNPTKRYGSYWLLAAMVRLQLACSQTAQVPETLIAFGSCGNQDLPQPVLSIAASYKPGAFIFLGDNIYGDTDDMDTLRAKYARWMAGPDFKKLAASTQIWATWDDHDFGRNDAGKEYPFKDSSKAIFLKAFGVADTSVRWQRPGIYDVTYLQEGNKRIQIILLDVRTFRNRLLYFNPKTDSMPPGFFYTPDYKIHQNADSTLLGDAQWRWLEQTLKAPADLRLICSGSQFGITYNGYEAWANFPHEQQRMLNIIKSTKANAVMFLTGDVHYAEISRLESNGLYPLYDVTASGITSTWDFATPNANRIEGPVMHNHFGLLKVRWSSDPEISMQIVDVHQNQRIEYTIKRSEICFTQ